ncbi:MAG: hypothetical protein QM642_01590 [Edaphocola sp.]
MDKRWYCAELIYCIGNEGGVAKFDKQRKWIAAQSAREAYQTSLIMASRELDLHATTNQVWEFAGLGLLEPAVQSNNAPDTENSEYSFADREDAKAHLLFLREQHAGIQFQVSLSA